MVCDSQDIDVQCLVNYLNETLGNYGKTLDVKAPSRQRQGNDADVAQLIDDLKAGNVSALFVAGTDLTHNLPDRETLIKAIHNVPLVVSFAERVDDFASFSHFVCPDHHPLESWMDAEPVSGVVSLSQPTLQPLGNTRSILESLNRWMGRTDSAYDTIQAFWRDTILHASRPTCHSKRLGSSRARRLCGSRPPTRLTSPRFNDTCGFRKRLALRGILSVALLQGGTDGQSTRSQPVAARASRSGHQGDVGQLRLRVDGDAAENGLVDGDMVRVQHRMEASNCPPSSSRDNMIASFRLPWVTGSRAQIASPR